MRPTPATTRPLIDRRAETARLEALLEGARSGHSGAVVVRGDPGVGKTALLDDLLTRAVGCRLIRAAGVESEMELARLRSSNSVPPILDHARSAARSSARGVGHRVGRLEPERRPDRFLVGLAILSLLSEVAADAAARSAWSTMPSGSIGPPRRCSASSRAVSLAEAVVDDLRGPRAVGRHAISPDCPSCPSGPLRDADARRLLASAMPGQLDEPVRDRIMAETRGNPLALAGTAAWRGRRQQLAGGFGIPGLAVSGRIEEGFRRRLDAAARREPAASCCWQPRDPVGRHAGCIWAAARRLGIPDSAASGRR